MPPPDRMLAALARAVARTADTPGRSGHLVRLQNCREVMVVGDLHGHVGNFQAVWKLAALATHPGRHLVFQELVHGPFLYANGGDKSHQVVDLVAALKGQFPDRVHYLPGNHELAQWTGKRILKGDTDQNEAFRKGVSAAYGPAAADIEKAYAEFFRVSPVGLVTPNRVFVSHTLPPAKHLATFDPTRMELDAFADADYLAGGTVYGLVWGRDTSDATAAAFLATVDCDLLVTGHMPADEGFDVPNPRQVTLDCSGTPGGFLLLPADRPIAHADLVAGVGVV